MPTNYALEISVSIIKSSTSWYYITFNNTFYVPNKKCKKVKKGELCELPYTTEMDRSATIKHDQQYMVNFNPID